MEPIFPVLKPRAFVVVSEFEAWRDDLRGPGRPFTVEVGDILHIAREGFYLVSDSQRVPVRFDRPPPADALTRHAPVRPRIAPPLEALSEIGPPQPQLKHSA